LVDTARLEAELFCAAQDFRDAERTAAILESDLRRIDRDLVEPQQK
jgi:hypothetical protein